MRASRRNWSTAAVLSVGAIAAIVTLTVSPLRRHPLKSSHFVGTDPAGEFAGTFENVDIPVGLLCDYYEHGVEHAPPRDPSGVMQRRERFYRSPRDPFEQSTFRKDPTLSTVLFRYEDDLRAGKPATGRVELLQRLADSDNLTSLDLIEVGRALNWIEGDEAATILFKAGLVKAKRLGHEVALSAIRETFVFEQQPGVWRRVQNLRPQLNQRPVDLHHVVEAAEGDRSTFQRWRGRYVWRISRRSIADERLGEPNQRFRMKLVSAFREGHSSHRSVDSASDPAGFQWCWGSPGR